MHPHGTIVPVLPDSLHQLTTNLIACFHELSDAVAAHYMHMVIQQRSKLPCLKTLTPIDIGFVIRSSDYSLEVWRHSCVDMIVYVQFVHWTNKSISFWKVWTQLTMDLSTTIIVLVKIIIRKKNSGYSLFFRVWRQSWVDSNDVYSVCELNQ